MHFFFAGLLIGTIACHKKPVPAPARPLLPAPVQGKWGYIDPMGQMIIHPRFSGAQNFSEGLAAVELDGKWGYIDSAGQVLIKPEYLFVRPFSEGFACVIEHPGGYSYIDRQDNTLITIKNHSLRNIVWRRNVDHSTIIERVIDPDERWSEEFSEGMAPIPSVDGTWGFMDRTAKVVIAPRFRSVRRFSDGRAAVKIGGEHDAAWGYIDNTGKMIIEPQFEDARDFSEGMASVCCDDNSNWGYIDVSGQKPFPSQFRSPGPYKEGLAYVEFGGGWVNEPYRHYVGMGARGAFIDKTGTTLFYTPSPLSIGRSLPEGLAPIEIVSTVPSDTVRGLVPRIRWGYMDNTGRLAIEPQFDKAAVFHQGLARVVVQGKVAYINKSGSVVWKSSD